MTAATPQTIQIAAGPAQLAGRFYPVAGPARATLLIHAATGVPQGFYRHFAVWANSRDLAVLTYDYRDFGDSQTGPMRDSRASFADWAARDQAAAQDALARIAPDGPLWMLGHSLGGLGLPFYRPHPRIERVVTYGAGMAHHRDHPWHFMPRALAFWFAIGPAAVWLAGYLPGQRLMLGADLPAGVYWQWRRWCTRREFFHPDIGDSLPQADFGPDIPDLRISVAADDTMVPPAAVRRFADLMAAAQPRLVTLNPGDFGLASLGHIAGLGRGHDAAWPALMGLPD